MKNNALRFATLFYMIGLITTVADEVTINPSDDATVAATLQPPQVNNNGYLLVRGSAQGVVLFPAPIIQGSFSNATLTVNPFSLPLRGTNVDIYGISEQSGFVSASDANAGTFLGTLQLPAGLSFGQDATFDVSTFVATNNSPFIGFNFRTIAGGVNDAIGLDIFSSLEFNYGHASQLYVSAQKVSVILPPRINCPDPFFLECTNGSAVGRVHVLVLDTNGLPLEVIWTADGTVCQTNDIPSGGNVTASEVSFAANFGEGAHNVTVSVSNGRAIPAACSTTVTVHDTTPPAVLAISATPSSLWPSNHKMVPVSVAVIVADNCDPAPTAQITQITSSEPPGPFAPDWQITGPLSANLRAERSGGNSRIYTIYVDITDSSGNKTTTTTAVPVPQSLTVSH